MTTHLKNLQKTRVIFMGSPDLSLPTLQALIDDANVEIVAVYTQPPRAKNRGKSITKTPVHVLAEENNLAVYTPINFKDASDRDAFVNHNAHIAVVIAYGLLLPKMILDAPLKGCINLHVSLLPRWRGSSPIQQAIWHGDQETGVTLMQMDTKLDHGPIFAMEKIPLTAQCTQESVFEELAYVSADLLMHNLIRIVNDDITAKAQPSDGVTLAPKILKEAGLIDWHDGVLAIDRQIRALTPWPGTFFVDENKVPLKIIRARPILYDNDYVPGTWLQSENNKLMIACPGGVIVIDTIQKPGGKALSADVFLRGYKHRITLIEHENL